MFRFDEAEINARFGYMLDLIPSAMMSRSAAFPMMHRLGLRRLPTLARLARLGHGKCEMGMATDLTGKLIRQNSRDAIEFVVRGMLDAILAGLIKKYCSVGRPLAVGPLEFDYGERELLTAGDGSTYVVEVTVITSVEWSLWE